MTYEYECEPCQKVFEEKRELPDRNRPATCPDCGGSCRKIMSRTHFNAIFPGSTRADMLADKYTQMSVEAQAEGFQSKTELEEARGQALDRARAMGQPDKQLIGPVESPVKTDYEPSAKDAAISNILSQRQLKAAAAGDKKKMQAAVEASAEHERRLRTKATGKKTEFKPKNTVTDLKQQVKSSQSQRGPALA